MIMIQRYKIGFKESKFYPLKHNSPYISNKRAIKKPEQINTRGSIDCCTDSNSWF